MTMMRISTLLTAFAVTLAASALATPSFAQRSEDGMTAARVAAIHDCDARVAKFKQYVWGDYEIDKYRACMAKHGQEE